MRIKLYLDKDVDISLAHALKQKGIDVLTTQETENKRLSDSEQLEFAVNSKRAIFTHNKRDFLLLHKNYLFEGKEHYGLILSDQRTVGEMLRGLSRLVFSLTAEQMKNRRESKIFFSTALRLTEPIFPGSKRERSLPLMD